MLIDSEKSQKILSLTGPTRVSTVQLCIRYAIQLGSVALPKTANLEHMKGNAAVDFEISKEDMETLVQMEKIQSYGEFDVFPVFSWKPL